MKAIVTLILALVAVALLAEPVADFTLEDIAGQKVQLSQLLKHGPVLVNFWATWCINCKKEMPKLSELQTKYPGITVLCITIDKPGKKAAAIQEVKTRQGLVLALVTDGPQEIRRQADWVIELPEVEESISPLLNVVPLQMLAYHVAVKRGCDVDQPRNLAKSVTVE